MDCPPGQKKSGPCREMAVSGGSPVIKKFPKNSLITEIWLQQSHSDLPCSNKYQKLKRTDI